MAWLNDFNLVAFVEASCERHGVQVKISDAQVRSDVAVLLSGRAVREAAKRAPHDRPDSDPPDRIDPVRVKDSTPSDSRSDHCPIQNSSNDGILSSEVEFPPLTA